MNLDANELQKILQELTPLMNKREWVNNLSRDQLRNLWLIGCVADSEIRLRELLGRS